MSILLDAGPSLNFLAVGQENILIQIAAAHSLQLMAPERVSAEVESMTKDSRFTRTGTLSTWRKLTAAGRVQILDDSLDRPELAEAVSVVSGMPAPDRMKERKNLGEIMVIAHASTFARQGRSVFVLIDDGGGRRHARREAERVQRAGAQGSIVCWSTPQVLREAEQHPEWIRGGHTWQQLYDRMRHFDDGLPPRPPMTN